MPLEGYHPTKLSWRRIISSLIIIPFLAKYAFWIENAGHNDLTANGGDAYLQAIQDFAAKLSD
ncbi:MAG: hypothetical protein IPN69_15630 [Acidobacteria bacterium]|nr:hypothetical protein [Acidobacteriota bacterium]MBK8812140.1 hypothetical protein [Acidobacteriota bacterium]